MRQGGQGTLEGKAPMTTIERLIADVIEEQGHNCLGYKECLEIAQALLASPLADIIDLAAWYDRGSLAVPKPDRYDSKEVRALLADWRASRAKRVEPEAPSRMMGSSVNEAPFERSTP